MLDACWAPSVAKEPEPKSITYQLDVTFDAAGAQLSRGIQEPRGAGRDGVAQCIQRELPPLTISPPGDTTPVLLELALP